MVQALTVSAANPAMWQSIGPNPMVGIRPQFFGPPFGTAFDATGRFTSLAIVCTSPGVGSSCNGETLFVGTAGGGVWMSSDLSNQFNPFTQITDSISPATNAGLPAQAIGSIAVDTSTSPITLYVGTGEGNTAIHYMARESMSRRT
jgi:hypothetical protein